MTRAAINRLLSHGPWHLSSLQPSVLQCVWCFNKLIWTTNNLQNKEKTIAINKKGYFRPFRPSHHKWRTSEYLYSIRNERKPARAALGNIHFSSDCHVGHECSRAGVGRFFYTPQHGKRIQRSFLHGATARASSFYPETSQTGSSAALISRLFVCSLCEPVRFILCCRWTTTSRAQISFGSREKKRQSRLWANVSLSVRLGP